MAEREVVVTSGKKLLQEPEEWDQREAFLISEHTFVCIL